MRRKRQIAIASALAIASLSGVGLTARALFFNGQQTFPAAARTARNVDLNFQKPGQVTVVDVKPGDYVHAGAELARIDDAGAKLEMNSAQSTLDLDRALLGLLQTPPPVASIADLQLAVQQAQQQVSSAQLNLHDVDAASQGAYTRAQTAAASAQTALSGDQQIQAQACASQAQTVECARLGAQLTRDQVAVSSAQQGVAHALQAAQQGHDRAQRAANTAQTGLSIAQARLGLKSGPAQPDRIQNVQAAVQKDQAQLALTRQRLEQYLLVAPSNGLVVEVNGEVGDLVSDAGVRNFPAPPPVVSAQPGLQLYGGPPTQPAATGGYSSFVRLADTTQWQMVAQVPEAAVPKLKSGLAALISFNALPEDLKGHLVAVIPAPFTVSNVVYYRVVFTLEHPPNELIPGMTGNVTVSLG
jgi:HlyD family secretion protein